MFPPNYQNRQARRAAYKQAVSKRLKSGAQKRMDRPDRLDRIDAGYRKVHALLSRAVGEDTRP